MAGPYTVAAAEHGAYAKTLVASTAETFTFDKDVERMRVLSDGSAAVYVTLDGSAPTVAGAATFELPAVLQAGHV